MVKNLSGLSQEGLFALLSVVAKFDTAQEANNVPNPL